MVMQLNTVKELRMFRIVVVAGLFMLTAFSPLSAADRGDSLEHTKDSLETVKERVKAEKAILVDVRELVEWNAGHIQRAVLLPWRELQDKPDEKKIREKLPKDIIVYTYCAVGYRSLRAGKLLTKYGYDVRPLKPGYDELVKAGFKSEKK